MTITEGERLETPKELAARVGVKERQIRHLIDTRQIEHVWIGCRVHIPAGAFTRFLEANKVKPCQDETKDPVSVGSQNASASTSPGPSTVAAASARLARQTASKLKSSSQNGSNSEGGGTAQVIPSAILVTDVLNLLSARARTEGRRAGAHRLCRSGADRLLRGQHRG